MCRLCLLFDWDQFSVTMTKSAGALVALLGIVAGLQQAAALEVATADEFVAAVKAAAKSIEVVDHLFLNTGAAVEEVKNQGSSGSGYLIANANTNSSLLTITVWLFHNRGSGVPYAVQDTGRLCCCLQSRE